jgi:hypothetical protein
MLFLLHVLWRLLWYWHRLIHCIDLFHGNNCGLIAGNGVIMARSCPPGVNWFLPNLMLANHMSRIGNWTACHCQWRIDRVVLTNNTTLYRRLHEGKTVTETVPIFLIICDTCRKKKKNIFYLFVWDQLIVQTKLQVLIGAKERDFLWNLLWSWYFWIKMRFWILPIPWFEMTERVSSYDHY